MCFDTRTISSEPNLTARPHTHTHVAFQRDCRWDLPAPHTARLTRQFWLQVWCPAFDPVMKSFLLLEFPVGPGTWHWSRPSVFPSAHNEKRPKNKANCKCRPTRCNCISLFIYLFLVSSTCFGTMFSPIIRSTWLYLQLQVLSTDTAAGWCHGWDVSAPDDRRRHRPKYVELIRNK